jgi:glyoxalase superfamily protein
MAYDFQIAVDCSDPHVLADWWAETLEWQVEPSDEAFIKDMVAKGFATDDQTRTHNGVLVWRAGQAITNPDPARTGAPRVLFQEVPEGKTVKNRLHLDVRVGPDRRDEVRDALVARGATFLWSASQGPHSWHTLADIEGNEFCVS